MTYTVLFIRHIEPVVFSPILPARESGPSVLEPTSPSGQGRHALGGSAWRFPSPGGSLRPRRPTAVRSAGCSGRQSRLHGEAPQEADPSSPSEGPRPRSFDHQLGGPGTGGTTSRRPASWVEPGLNVNWLSNYNPCRIVWPH